MTRQEYFTKYAPLVAKVTAGTGLFPSVMLAQGAIESGNGKSSLASVYNNHFGIKAGSSWKGKTVTLQTHEVINGQTITVNGVFRAYDTPEEGFADRVNFLKSIKKGDGLRYQAALVAKTPDEQAQALQDAGYATAPDYASVISSVIKNNNLTAYDSGQKKKEDNNNSVGSININKWSDILPK